MNVRSNEYLFSYVFLYHYNIPITSVRLKYGYLVPSLFNDT